MYESEVSVSEEYFQYLLTQLPVVFNQGKPVNQLTLSSSLLYLGVVNTGCKQLACLAKLVLSIVANSAGAEWLFSWMGQIYLKHRQQMHYDNMHHLATVAMDLDTQHQAGRACW